jgi:serine/threonine-protein kinase
MASGDTRQVGARPYTVRLLAEHRDPEGAFATRFYEAWDPALQRQVALKEMAALQQNERSRDFLARARDEARLLARIGEQPNLPLIYDMAEEDNGVWLVMEFVKGTVLAKLYLRPDARPPDRDGILTVLSIILDVCRALQTLHGQRIAHRDIAPTNIIVGPRGAKLVDVGLAVWPSRRAFENWEEGEGTRGYRAPEQTAWRGPLAIPSLASDVYSLGALLYRLLTASPLPPLPPSAQPPPPSRSNPMVPPALDQLVLAALAYVPKERPGIGQFYQQLRAVRDALRQDHFEVQRSPLPEEPPGTAPAPATAEGEAIAAEEKWSVPPPRSETSPLTERYNEGMPEPPPLPAMPPLPHKPQVIMPAPAEQARAKRTVLIAAGGVVFACITALVSCAFLFFLTGVLGPIVTR